MFPQSRSANRAREAVSFLLACLLVCLTLPTWRAPVVAAPRARQDDIQPPQIPVIPAGQAYRQTNLVSDIPGLAFVEDPLLVNPWGITSLPTSPFWVVNNGTSTTQLFRGDVSGSPFTLNPGLPTVNIPGGLPTGTVANATSDFNVAPPSGTPAPARFIFDSITGNIIAWQPALGNTAQVVVNTPGHAYTGLAIGSNAGGNRLYAADFANNHIDVFNGTFTPTTVTGNFTDPTVPPDHHVFNIQNIGGALYVTYAKIDPLTGRSVNGPGLGYVRRFNTDGVRDLSFAINNGMLDAPWGVTIAPTSFGTFGGALLVGNFSDEGFIDAYNVSTGAFLGQLQNEAGEPIEIDELWALSFGNGAAGGNPNTLYFTSGLGEEEHGLIGKLQPTTQSATSLIQFSTDEYDIGEGAGSVQITVTRSGDLSGAASVNFSTFDESQAGHASQKSDYEISLGTIRFNPGESSKTFRILLVNDRLVEGTEEVDLALSNPTGAGVGLGSPNIAELKILDDDATPTTSNPIDDAQFFVRQQYLDFLNREPDPAGLAFWTNQITSCGANAQCVAQQRINVSAAFFLSIEFQRTGMLAYLTERAAFGGLPTYGRFEQDTQALQQNYVFGAPGSDAQLEANKQQFFNDFVNRPEFIAKYGSLTNDQYVDALLGNAVLDPAHRRFFVANLQGGKELPANASPGTGTATLFLSSDETTASVSLTFSNLTSPETAAHIHGPADVNATAPVLFPLPLGQFSNFQISLTPSQVADLRAGKDYVNVHTTVFPNGEIRGQFPNTSIARAELVNGLNAGTETRATVLRKIAESQEFALVQTNNAFVLMEYFGYLRRNPDMAGFNFWLNKLNAFNGNFNDAEMVKAFITSSEYRQRFGAS